MGCFSRDSCNLRPAPWLLHNLRVCRRLARGSLAPSPRLGSPLSPNSCRKLPEDNRGLPVPQPPELLETFKSLTSLTGPLHCPLWSRRLTTAPSLPLPNQPTRSGNEKCGIRPCSLAAATPRPWTAPPLLLGLPQARAPARRGVGTKCGAGRACAPRVVSPSTEPET